MNFKDVAEEWYESQMITLSYGYRMQVKSYLNHLINSFGDEDVKNIVPRDMDRLILKLSIKNPNTDKPCAKKTLKELICTASRIFEYAIENKWAKENPAKGKKPPKNSPLTRRRSLTKDEQDLIMCTYHRARIAAMIMMFAGLRRGEVIALKWSDIDFDKKTIFVANSAQQISPNEYIIKSGTKNGKKRVVPIPQILINELFREIKESKSQFVVPKKDGKMQTPGSWKSLWISYQKALNFEARSDRSLKKYNPHGIPKCIDTITAHMLRHTYATILYNSGVDVKTAQFLMGHSNLQTTLEIYVHLDESKRIESIDELENYICQNYALS